jgi:hypothetical protein
MQSSVRSASLANVRDDLLKGTQDGAIDEEVSRKVDHDEQAGHGLGTHGPQRRNVALVVGHAED